MRSFNNMVLNRRQLVALGLGTTATFGLAACGGSEQKPADDAAATTNANASNMEDAEEKTSALDTAAFDALVSGGPVADDAAIAASEWATKVKEAGVLRVGGVETSTLFSQLNEKDGHHRGFDAGLFQLLANYILGDSSAYKLTLVQSSTRESVLQNDTVDAVFATYSITDERKKLISFAGPYYVGHQGILVMPTTTDINDVEDLAGKIVGVQEGAGQSKEEFISKYMPDAEVQKLGTDGELRRVLEQGRINAYVTDAALLKSDMVENPDKYRLAAEFGDPDPLGIGLPLDSDGVDFVNDFLQTIEDEGIWTDLYQLFFGEEGSTTPPEIEREA